MTCWKSRVRDATGVERVSRGCTTKQDHLPLYCTPKNISDGPKKRDAATPMGVYNVECCEGDYCNNGSFPYLPPLKEELPDEATMEEALKLAFAILIPLVVFVFITVFVILLMRRNHKKRLDSARNKQDTDPYYANDDILKRSHACGDSTLRVRRFFSQEIFQVMNFCSLQF